MLDNNHDDLAQMQADIERKQSALIEAVVERDQLEARIRAERDAIEALKAQRDTLRIQAMASTVDWAHLLNSTSPEAYKERNRLLHAANFTDGGGCIETGQAIVRFMLTKNRPGEVERACAFVRQVLPAIQVRAGGAKWLGVLEWTLSQHASYKVRIKEATNEYAVVTGRPGRESDAFKTDSLESLVQYLHDHRYYALFGDDD